MQWTELTLNLLYSAIGILIIGAVGALLAWLLWRVLRVKSSRAHVVDLENKGNCRSIYYLEVKSPEPSLQFSLSYNGSPLAPVYLPVETEDTVEVSTGKNPSEPVSPTNKAGSPALAAGAETVTKTGQSASSAAARFASLLEQVGEILPGSLGSSLKQQSTKLRSVQVKATRVARKPQRIRRQVTGFHQLGHSQNKSTAGQPAAGLQKSGTLPVETNEEKIRETCFVQTPVVEAGQALHLELKVRPRRRAYQPGTYPYTLEALPMPVDFPELLAKPQLQNGTVSFKSVEAWRLVLPVLMIIAVSLASVAAMVFLYRFIWL